MNGRRMLDAPCKTPMEVLRSMPDASQFVALVPMFSEKLRDALSSRDGPDASFFVPTNAALSNFKHDMPDVYDAIARNGTMMLTALMSSMVVPGRLVAAKDLGSAPLRTALGDALPPLTASGMLIKGVGSSAKIVHGDVNACHAKLHLIGDVIFPLPMPTHNAVSDAADKVKSAMAQG